MRRSWLLLLSAVAFPVLIGADECQPDVPIGEGAVCGDGVVDDGEDCDGTVPASASCGDFGHDGGTLSCSANCSFDTSSCTDALCTDGDEGTCSCEGASGTRRCQGGQWTECACDAVCEEGLSRTCPCALGDGESRCVNGQWTACDCPGECDPGDERSCICRDGGEQGVHRCGPSGEWLECDCSPECEDDATEACTCDVGEPGTRTCRDGQWSTCDCGSVCEPGDTRACPCTSGPDGVMRCVDGQWFGCECIGECGNHEVEGDEQCDLENLDGRDCQALGFSGGDLSCDSACAYDASECIGEPECGDSIVVEGHEDCEGDELLGRGCEHFGFAGGTLACTDCNFDTSGCIQGPECQNGEREGDEQCDQDDLNNMGCEDLGFDGGTLGCTQGCVFDTNGCSGTVVGFVQVTQDQSWVTTQATFYSGMGPGTPLPELGTCEVRAVGTPHNPEDNLDAGIIRILDGVVSPVTLTPGAQHVYESDLPGATHLLAEAGTSLRINGAGGSDVGSFSGAVMGPAHMRGVSHSDFNRQGGYDTSAPMTFSWTSGGDGAILIHLMEDDDQNPHDTPRHVLCHVADTGSFTVSEEMMEGFTGDRSGFVLLSRTTQNLAATGSGQVVVLSIINSDFEWFSVF